MMEIVSQYVDLILRERFWSWSVIGIVYLIFAFTVRGWFMNPLFSGIKSLGSQPYHDFKQEYLKLSFWGWFFFFLPLVILTYVWNQTAKQPLGLFHQILIVAGAALFFWSIMVHMKSFCQASVVLLKKKLGEQEKQQPTGSADF
ncbi:MAG: hypothetical protein FGM27_06430 [Candidatus Omnitrophica bacterium]|nr:hypothetical protein [Candidatus Omnitrophota bacterium]